MCYSFFNCKHDALRDLHSFPTRRSSDLGHGMLKVWMSHGDEVTEMPAGFKLMASTDACPIAAMADESQDRKSTRLNSSHSQISYAVFCLKKKKKKNK